MTAKKLEVFWPRFHGAFLRDASVSIFIVFIAVIVVLLAIPVSEATRLALFVSCICAPASMLLRFNSAVANSVRRYSLSVVPDFIVRPGLLLLILVSAYLFGTPLTVIQTLVAFSVVMFIVSLVQALMLGKKGALPSYWFEARPRFSKILRARALPLAFIAAVATSFSDIVTLVGGLLLPPDDVALLAVAIRLAAIAGFVIQVAQQFILPDLTQAVTQRDGFSVHKILTQLNLLTISIIMAGLLGTWVLGPYVLQLFGTHYVMAQNILLAFMVGQSIRAFSGMNQQLISMAGAQSKTVISCVVAIILFVGCSTILVPPLGMIALGYSAIIAELAWSIMLASQALRLTGRRGDIFWLLANPVTH